MLLETKNVDAKVQEATQKIEEMQREKRLTTEEIDANTKTIDIRANRALIQQDETKKKLELNSKKDSDHQGLISKLESLHSDIAHLELPIKETKTKLKAEDYDSMLIQKDLGNENTRLKLLMAQHEELKA